MPGPVATEAPLAPRSRTTRRDGRATRSRILRAAESLFAAGGFEATSLRQIAGAADIDLATLKYHFGDKPALFAEVYQRGHERFVAFVAPYLMRLAEVSGWDDVRVELGRLAEGAYDFVVAHMAFVRLVLYRFLEDSSEVTGLEEELQVGALDQLDGAFRALIERGAIRDIDTRAFVTMLTTSIAMFFVVVNVRPTWVGEPLPSTPEGRARSIAFFEMVLVRSLQPGGAV